MIDFKIKRAIWIFLIGLTLWGISDLLIRYRTDFDIKYLASAFFSSFILVLIGFLKP